MYYNLKKVFGILTFIVGVIFSSPTFASGYYGGSKGEEIFINGEVIVGGIAELQHKVRFMHKDKPLVMIKYQGKLYRCTISMDIDGGENIRQEDDGFEVHCWGRKKD